MGRGREGDKKKKTGIEKRRFTYIERRKVNGSVAGKEMTKRRQVGVLRKRGRMGITRRGMVGRESTRTRERRRRKRRTKILILRTMTRKTRRRRRRARRRATRTRERRRRQRSPRKRTKRRTK